jgi:hypothetical protein
MRHPVLRRPAILAAAVAACALAAPSSAATPPKAAITDSYDDLAPFGQRLDIPMLGCVGQGAIQVPTGVRLVIDYITGDITPGPATNAFAVLDTTVNGAGLQAFLPVTPAGQFGSGPVFLISAPVHLYVDPGKSLHVEIVCSGSNGSSGSATVSLYGHYVPAN